MNTNILQHLINLKKFSDYKSLKFDSYRVFINHIENGGSLDVSKQISTQYDIEDMLDENFDPTDEEIELDRERKAYEVQRDYFEEYNNSVRDLIERHLSYAQVALPKTMKLGNLITIITDNKLFVIKQEVFNQWLSITKNYPANMFFKNLIELEESDKARLLNNKLEIKSNPDRTIFVSNESFTLFFKYIEHLKGVEHAHYSYIYRKLQEDGLIYPDVGDSQYRRFLEDHLRVDLNYKTKTLADSSPDSKDHIYCILKGLCIVDKD